MDSEDFLGDRADASFSVQDFGAAEVLCAGFVPEKHQAGPPPGPA
jgi:hypothetical protein